MNISYQIFGPDNFLINITDVIKEHPLYALWIQLQWLGQTKLLWLKQINHKYFTKVKHFDCNNIFFYIFGSITYLYPTSNVLFWYKLISSSQIFPCSDGNLDKEHLYQLLSILCLYLLRK